MANTRKVEKFWMVNTQNFEHFGKMDPVSKGFPPEKWTNEDFLVKKRPTWAAHPRIAYTSENVASRSIF